MSSRFNLEDYISVQERINLFWTHHPNGRILTALMSDPADFTQCRYRADVYLDSEDTRPITTGWAFEIAGKGMANQTSHEENCETSAIGRALANLGYATSQKDRPSREEMTKVSRYDDAPPDQHQPMRQPMRQQAPPPRQQQQQSYGNGGGRSYPTVNQLPFARKVAEGSGLAWDTQADEIIYLATGIATTTGTVDRNDTYQDVIAWMQAHKGAGWERDPDGNLYPIEQ